MFFLTGLLAVTSHWFTQYLTAHVVTLYASAVPALVLGIVGGALIDRRIDKDKFRIVVIAMIFFLGLSLILGGR